MNRSVSVFIPTRKGSERVKNKNTRPFSGIEGGLLKIKVSQVLSMKNIDEVILSTNDPDSMKAANEFSDERLKIRKRPEHLARSSTNLVDLIEYVPTVCGAEHILWTHVTSPFTKSEHYSEAIQTYFEKLNTGEHDSLMSGRWFQNFLWSPDKKEVVNKKSDLKWPRTQDLEKLFEVNSAIFLASRNIYNEHSDRVGVNPYLYSQKELASFDIDWKHDFIIAEKLFSQ